jgi:hypothetical protein
MKVLFIVVVLGLVAGCGEKPKAPAPKPAGTAGQPLNAGKPAENLNAQKPGESEAEANMRGLLRLDGHACDRVTGMQGDAQGGTVTCSVGGGSKTYVADTATGKFKPQ